MTPTLELLDEMRRLLQGSADGSTEPELRWIVEAATEMPFAAFVARDRAPSPDVAERAVALARRRAHGEPVQYVTGIAGFRRLELAVGPGVFIPRPETELVAGRAMALLPRGGTVVDVGTGSGAIALSVADERPDATVYATESSRKAMSWAERNRDELAKSVDLILCDVLAGLPQRLRGCIDVVVSNPPYVPASARGALPRDVVEHEPAEALFSDGDGLSAARTIASQATSWLKPGGWLVLEIGEEQARRATKVLRDLGYSSISVTRDLAGKDRIVEGRFDGDRHV